MQPQKRGPSRELFPPGPNKRQRTTLALIPRSPLLSPAQKAQVNKLIIAKDEIKYYDRIILADTISTAGTVSNLFRPAQGSVQTQRVTDSCRMLSLKWNMQLLSADAYNVIRVIIFQWNVNTTLFPPAVATILAIGPSGAPDVNSQYNYQYRKQYKILYDEVFNCVAATDSVNVVRVNQRYTFKPANQKVIFTSGAVDGQGETMILYISDSVAVAHPTFTGHLRTFFIDA